MLLARCLIALNQYSEAKSQLQEALKGELNAADRSTVQAGLDYLDALSVQTQGQSSEK
jgi:hypothetical protein